MVGRMIVGNWKMHLLGQQARELAGALVEARLPAATEIVVCPPFVHLGAVGEILANSTIRLGGQDCHQGRFGAHTGDVSAPMLADLGARYVILGHSERRRAYGEIDEVVRLKSVSATEAGLTPIVCVGETEDQRSSGQAHDIVGWQIEGSLPKGFSGVVAYEPVWAIGRGKAASTQEIAGMIAFVRAELIRQFGEAGKAIRILYGGSVNGGDASAIMAIPEVGGALVGGASLTAGSFLEIIRAASGD
jgi:triosephosphate isomerase (TIM)